MQQLIYFIRKFRFFLYFLLLQTVAVVITINNHNFHKSKFISATNIISGSLYSRATAINDYFNLKTQNTALVRENQRLKNKLAQLQFINDSIVEFTHIDTTKFKQQYSYINAKIIDNVYYTPNNFLLINRGKNEEITAEMGVINDKGIIGITDDVSSHYARVQSILNGKSKINARFKNSHHFGTLIWNNKDYNIVQLTDIPRQATYKVGDTIITGGKSTIFPEGIPVGTVLNVPEKHTASNTIDVLLFNDMSNLHYIYVIKNFHKNEIKALEQLSNE